MSFSSETLQDFVVTILNDEAAKAAYLADPTAALRVAGLGDLTPADVREVLPLVADSLPALPADLSSGVPGLGDLPVALPADVPVDLARGLVGVDLDTEALSIANTAQLSNPDEAGAPTVWSDVDTVFGAAAAGAKLAPEEFGGSLTSSSPVADTELGLLGHPGADLAGWADVDTVAGDLGGGVLAGQDGVTIAGATPLGGVSLSSGGGLSLDPADPADLLDIDHLGTTGDAVAGTVAHYVSTGAVAGASALGGYLTGSADPVGDTIDASSASVPDGVQRGGDTASEHLTTLPLDQLPELPRLPDTSDLPAMGDVAGHLPVDLPALPVQLPDTSAVTDLVSHNPVTDAVHASPVGGLVEGVTGHLPRLPDLPGDLDLGL